MFLSVWHVWNVSEFKKILSTLKWQPSSQLAELFYCISLSSSSWTHKHTFGNCTLFCFKIFHARGLFGSREFGTSGWKRKRREANEMTSFQGGPGPSFLHIQRQHWVWSIVGAHWRGWWDERRRIETQVRGGLCIECTLFVIPWKPGQWGILHISRERRNTGSEGPHCMMTSLLTAAEAHVPRDTGSLQERHSYCV